MGGTAQYVPPELLDKAAEVDFAAMDLWALGILVFHCLCDETPFAAPNQYLTFKNIEEWQSQNITVSEYTKKEALQDQGLIDALLKADLNERLGMPSMGGYDALMAHPFFAEIASWDVSEMHSVKVPSFPATPKNSPVHDEEKKGDKMLRGSVFTEDENENNEKVKENGKDTKEEKKESEYAKWEPFLNASSGECIEMGSTVSRSRYLGMGSEKSVLLLTSHRVLLIDPTKMKLRKNGDMRRQSVQGVVVEDKETFVLRLEKSKLKFKCSGPKAQKWKAAFEKGQ